MVATHSTGPQARKLGVKPGMRVDLVAAPVGWSFEDPRELRPAEPDGVDVVVAFVRSAAELGPIAREQGRRIFPDGSLWIAWPRRAAGHVSDVTDNLVREVILPLGLVDVKVAAIDTDWSGLKIVWRVERRTGQPQ